MCYLDDTCFARVCSLQFLCCLHPGLPIALRLEQDERPTSRPRHWFSFELYDLDCPRCALTRLLGVALPEQQAESSLSVVLVVIYFVRFFREDFKYFVCKAFLAHVRRSIHACSSFGLLCTAFRAEAREAAAIGTKFRGSHLIVGGPLKASSSCFSISSSVWGSRRSAAGFGSGLLWSVEAGFVPDPGHFSLRGPWALMRPCFVVLKFLLQVGQKKGRCWGG